MLYDACSFMQTYGDEREILFKMRKEIDSMRKEMECIQRTVRSQCYQMRRMDRIMDGFRRKKCKDCPRYAAHEWDNCCKGCYEGWGHSWRCPVHEYHET